MLGTCCEKCETILLQDQKQRLYCIGCEELDKVPNTVPNNGSSVATDGSSTKQHLKNTSDTCDVGATRYREQEGKVPLVSYMKKITNCAGDKVGLLPMEGTVNQNTIFSAEDLTFVGASLSSKMKWAAMELERCSSVDISLKYLEVIKSCTDNLDALQKLINN